MDFPLIRSAHLWQTARRCLCRYASAALSAAHTPAVTIFPVLREKIPHSPVALSLLSPLAKFRVLEYYYYAYLIVSPMKSEYGHPILQEDT